MALSEYIIRVCIALSQYVCLLSSVYSTGMCVYSNIGSMCIAINAYGVSEGVCVEKVSDPRRCVASHFPSSY